MNCKNYERIAGNVAEYSLENADGCNVWNFACKQECGDESDDACDGTCDKLGEAFTQVVIHDAEIRTRRFQKSVGNKTDDANRCDDCCVFHGVCIICRNGAVDFFDGFLAETTAPEEK